jgi:sortase A
MLQLPLLSGWRECLMLCLVLVGMQQIAGAGIIKAKAWLAPVLIERAWQQTLSAGGVPVKPWPWADTWPVAHLSVPELGRELLVLAGDSGNALAFGPGHARASAELGSPGLAVVAGHRDTHFAFLQKLRGGEAVLLQLPSGAVRTYRVQATRVVDADRERLPVTVESESLMLVTCYPFATLRAGGSLRFVVTALPLQRPEQLALGPDIDATVYAM